RISELRSQRPAATRVLRRLGDFSRRTRYASFDEAAGNPLKCLAILPRLQLQARHGLKDLLKRFATRYNAGPRLRAPIRISSQFLGIEVKSSHQKPSHDSPSSRIIFN